MDNSLHISIAPMMDWTDRHCRYFHRLLSPNVRLYTEMVTTGALLHGDVDRHLRFNDIEHYVALQLGGSEPADLATAAKMGEDYGYDEINLNCGCPSERVQRGAFGACLMAEPDTVADCVAAMKKAVNIPVTVKCRIGIDDSEDYVFLRDFVARVADAGCEMFIIHARKAWLKGLSPKENREIPPLDYSMPARIKAEFPNLQIIVNGGIKTIDEISSFLHSPSCHPGKGEAFIRDLPDKIRKIPGQARDDRAGVDGVMIGREAYHNPSILLDIEREIFGNAQTCHPERLPCHPERSEGSQEILQTLPRLQNDKKAEVVKAMIPYIEEQQSKYGTPINSVTRHMIPLFQGERGSRAWRRALSTEPHKEGTKADFLLKALSLLEAI